MSDHEHPGPRPDPPAEPDLRAALEGLAATRAEAGRLVGPLDEPAFRWQPEPERWSVGHCILHLARTAEAYLPALDGAIESARGAGRTGTGPFRYGWLSRRFVRAMEPPPGLRFRAPGSFRPDPPGSPDEVMAAYRAAHRAVAERARRADGLDLRVKLRSPASRLLPLPLGQAFLVLAAHERRHLWQARRVVAHPEFPGGRPSNG